MFRRHGLATLLAVMLLLAFAPAGLPQPAQAATCPTELVLGQLFDCGITAASEVDNYTFAGAINDRFVFRVLRTTGTFTPRVRVLNPDGVQVCDTWSSTRTVLACDLTSSGTHTLRIFDFSGTNTGNYTVYAQRLNGPVAAQPIVTGELYSADLASTIEADVYSLSAEANDQIEIRVLRTTGNFTPHINVYNALGARVCGTWGAPLAQSAPCALGPAGTYALMVDDYGLDNTGAYQLIVQRRGIPRTSTVIAPGQIYQGSITTPIATQVYTIDAANNDRLVLRVRRETGAMTPHLRVFSPGGEQVCRTWAAPLAALEPCDLDQAGVYTLLVDDYSVASTGTFTLHTQRLNNPGATLPLPFGPQQSNSIDQPAALDTYTFQAQANDVVSLTIRRTAGSFTPHIRVFDPGGQQICRTWGAPTATLSRCVIATSGRYTVLADDYSASATGDYTLTLGCVSGACQERLFLPLVRKPR